MLGSGFCPQNYKQSKAKEITKEARVWQTQGSGDLGQGKVAKVLVLSSEGQQRHYAKGMDSGSLSSLQKTLSVHTCNSPGGNRCLLPVDSLLTIQPPQEG